MSSMIFKKCESCLVCATTQGQERRQNPELHSIPVGEPFACIGMDFKEKWMKVLIRIDLLWYFRITDQTASTVAKCLADLIYRHGVPSTIIRDRAPEFLSDVLQDIAFIIGIKQLPTSPGHPQCDGLVERFNRILKTMLSKLVVNKGRDWDQSVRTTFICVPNNATFFYRRNTIFSIVWQRRKITITFRFLFSSSQNSYYLFRIWEDSFPRT